MISRLGGAVLVLLAVVGCGSDSESSTNSLTSGSDASAIVSTTSSVAPAIAPTSTVADQQYTVASGDALYAIADSLCTTAEAIVTANGWADGVNHPLFPGDVITVPGGGCGATASTVGTASTATGGETSAGATNQYVERYLADRSMTLLFYGDRGNVGFFEPECNVAYTRELEFSSSGAPKGPLLDALEALTPEVPPAVLAFIDVFDAFNQRHHAAYKAAETRYYEAAANTMSVTDEAERERLQTERTIQFLTDPAYVAAMAASEAISFDHSVEAWLRSVCTADPDF